PAEDFHISWSPDGTLVGFTSDRGATGTANLFAMDITTWHLWQLTNDNSHNDHAAFSPDGRFVAFESTRGGDAAVYLMPALGGTVSRVTPVGGRYAAIGWRGERPRFVDRIRIVGPVALPLGGSAAWGIL